MLLFFNDFHGKWTADFVLDKPINQRELVVVLQKIEKFLFGGKVGRITIDFAIDHVNFRAGTQSFEGGYELFNSGMAILQLLYYARTDIF